MPVEAPRSSYFHRSHPVAQYLTIALHNWCPCFTELEAIVCCCTPFFRPMAFIELHWIAFLSAIVRALASSTHSPGPHDPLCLNAIDKKLWDTRGRSDFLEDMDACGNRCLGRAACAAGCLQAKQKYSSPCASCFGELISCSASKCWLPCSRGGETNPNCRSCVERAGCKTSFQMCSGINDLPQREDSERLDPETQRLWDDRNLYLLTTAAFCVSLATRLSVASKRRSKM